REATRSKDLWTINFIPVILDQKKNFDYTKCDVEVYFEREPQDESQKFISLGVTALNKSTSQPIITIYYLQIDPNLKYHDRLEGNIIYYWYEGEPRYLDHLRNDDQLASVIRHEIGHALGLGHYMVYDADLYEMWEGGRTVPPSAMIPISPEFTGRVGITTTDIEKMITIYGYDGFGPKPSSSVAEPDKMKPTLSTIVLESYENEKYQFSIDVPKGWDIENFERTESSDPIVFLQNDLANNSAWVVVYLLDKREESVTSEKYLTVLTNEEEKKCNDASLEVEKYTCMNFKVMDSDIIQIKGEKAYQLRYSWIQDKKFSFGTIITEIPKGDEVWRIESDIFGPDYADFIGKVESSINSFMLVSNKPTQPKETQEQIPPWIKNNAKWWSEGSINDDDFTKGIQFLIKEGVMKIPKTESSSVQPVQKIPDWIKNNAQWWSDGQISDSDFIKGIQYLVEHGIIKV
ncbi:MAG TPA: hypothetical protein VD699_01525, partial [Nitrosopumilaceae archaeon]|nr:hypothetical protein [Nitrosopumilaceae archaeon]